MTTLLYLEQMDILSSEATVQDVLEEEGKQVVILDQTILYPQGGGQPYDTGTIESESGKFAVEQVRFVEGIVKHIGTFTEKSFQKGEKVNLSVNPERRLLNSRLHSAGHLVDMGIYELKPDWIPGKGYHFPDGPYVEYEGTFSEPEREQLIKNLQETCNNIISKNPSVEAKIITKDELGTYCRHIPTNIPEGKPIRIVLFGDFGVPCGGTHVKNLSELKSIVIRKIRGESGKVKVSYDVERT